MRVGKTNKKVTQKMTKITPILVRFHEYQEHLEVRRILKADNSMIANLL